MNLFFIIAILGFSQFHTDNIVRLSDNQVEEILLTNLDEYNKPLYYGLYLTKEQSNNQNIKVGHASVVLYIDTLTDNERYYNEEAYFKFYNGSYELFSKSVYNAIPPYQFIKDEIRVVQYGNEFEGITSLVGNKYITTLSNGIDVLDIDSNNCKISDYGLRDYFATSLINNKDDIIKTYSLTMGVESIDSTVVVRVRDHFVNGGNMKSYTTRIYSSLDDYKEYTEMVQNEYGEAIMFKVDNDFEGRLESEIQAKDTSYVADLFTLNCIQMLPSYPENNYDTTKIILGVTYEIHGEYNNLFLENIHQELFKENGRQYIRFHNLDKYDVLNESEKDSLSSNEDFVYSQHLSEISDLAQSSIKGAKTDSMKIVYLLDFVHNYIEYAEEMAWHLNVYDIIKSKKGVCADYAHLFNVLSRNLGFPCKEVVGVAFDGVSNSWGSHAWNEVAIDNKWYSVDPTVNIWPPTYYYIKTEDEFTSLNKFKLSCSEITLEDGVNVRFRSDIGCVSGNCDDGYGVFMDPDGFKYVGEWKEGLYHGQGTLSDLDESKYVGEWKEGKFHGQGTLTYSDGSKYVGEWEEGNMHGQGILTDSNGTKYVGEFEKGLFHGQGTFTYSDGTKYVGEFEKGLYHRQGTITYSDGSKYVGEWKEGLYHGQGTLSDLDESKYVGEWKEGKFHGQGTLTVSNRFKYTGAWKESLYHGQGTLTDSNGTKYVGEFEKGLYHGQGTLTYSDGSKYVGEWKEGLYHGQGTITYSDGSKYVGEWKEGLYHGQGTFSDLDESKYVGEWKEGKFHGQGTLTISNGLKYIGEWKESLYHGQGTLTDSNGDKYIGEWKDGKKEGIGKLTYSDGKVEEGKFMLDVYIGKE